MTTTIVAEIGINWCPNLQQAMDMMIKAKNIGADYVKFQLWEVSTCFLSPCR